MKKQITITIPLDLALEMATYGINGRITKFSQITIEKEIKRLGFMDELNDIRDKKAKNNFENLNRILGSDVMNKLEDTIKLGKDAIKVANRMNKN